MSNTQTRQTESLVCDPQMRDVWSRILPFMRNPGTWRCCSHYTLGAWEHALYLEGELPCFTATLFYQWAQSQREVDEADGVVVPVLVERANRIPGSLPGIKTITQLNFVKVRGLRALLPLSPVLGQGVQRIQVADLDVAVIEGTFAQEHAELEYIRMGTLPLLEETHDNAFSGLPSLTRFDITGPLPQLQKIGSCWLAEVGLVHVNLDGEHFPALRVIAEACLAACKNLTFARIAGFTNLETISSSFLSRCPNLAEVYLEDLPALTSLGTPAHEYGMSGGCFTACPRLKKMYCRRLPVLDGGDHYRLLAGSWTRDPWARGKFRSWRELGEVTLDLGMESDSTPAGDRVHATFRAALKVCYKDITSKLLDIVNGKGHAPTELATMAGGLVGSLGRNTKRLTSKQAKRKLAAVERAEDLHQRDKQAALNKAAMATKKKRIE